MQFLNFIESYHFLSLIFYFKSLLFFNWVIAGVDINEDVRYGSYSDVETKSVMTVTSVTTVILPLTRFVMTVKTVTLRLARGSL